jgi:hypothetical protein
MATGFNDAIPVSSTVVEVKETAIFFTGLVGLPPKTWSSLNGRERNGQFVEVPGTPYSIIDGW